MTCQWCGDKHGTDQLCQRAERGMTRRSFCFLFGAGIAGAMLPAVAPLYRYQWVGDKNAYRRSPGSHQPVRPEDVTHVNLYSGPPDGPHTLIGTFPAHDIKSITIGASVGLALHGNVMATGRTASGETIHNLLRAKL